MDNIETPPQKKEDPAGLFIPAGLFLGFGIGFLTHNLLVGMFVGLGLGFVVFALVRMFKH